MSDYDAYGLQFDTEKEDLTHLNLGKIEKEGNSLGMLDCGATCSAGPETSIRNLLQAVISQDNSAAISVDAKKRPKFRFGSGAWGQALYLIRIQSSVTNKFFEAFVLPDPETPLRPGFEHVPVLVGMDFIRQNGLIIDFTDGYVVCAQHANAKPFYMPVNAKGHFMVDLVNYDVTLLKKDENLISPNKNL